MKKIFVAIGISGFAAFVSLVATFVIGITHLNFELHKKCAFATIGFGLVHFGLILYKNHRVSKAKKASVQK
ncbi:MAG: hypothetical protein M0Q46_04295 [Endomicrobiales bacterium]|nr:hypothetical protein [Endomicrobiales bacterium]